MTAQPSTSLSISATPLDSIGELALEWRELESRSDSHPFFLSWHWIGSWLCCLPPHVKPLVLRISKGGEAAGLAMLVEGKTRVLGFFSLRQIAVNATGLADLDSITIEYNGFLTASNMGDTVTRAALEWLMGNDLPNQALHLGGINSHLAEIAASLAAARGRRLHLISAAPAPFVDLNQIRRSGGDYFSHLSRNSRQSLRRAIRHHESQGPLRYHRAASLAEARSLFDELESAHQAYWSARGKPGAFAQPFFKQFHIALIDSAFGGGHIEIARISAGDQPLGYLYNFIWRGTVYAYQSAFRHTADKADKPGYVSHYLAIMNALEQGLDIYDFMAGARQHKTSLSTGQQNLAWLQLRSQLLSVSIEAGLRKVFRGIRYGQVGD